MRPHSLAKGQPQKGTKGCRNNPQS